MDVVQGLPCLLKPFRENTMKKIAILLLATVAVVGCASHSAPQPSSHHVSGGKLG